MDPSPSASAGDRPREGIGRSDGAFRLAGEWLVEPALHRLRRLDGAGRAGDPLQVEPKVLGVLVELSREPGRVVSQEALRERVWGSAHVSDEVVRRAIYELRKVLGEEASAPRYIETVPRVGYRLIAPVEGAEAGGGAERGAHGGAAGSGLAARRRYLPAALLALLVVTPVVGFLAFWNRERPAVQAPRPTVRPLTSLPGLEYDPAFSPDGSRIAYVRARSDGTGAALHVQVVGEGAPLRLIDGGEQPCWRADGRRILFVARSDAPGRAPEEVGAGPSWELRSIPALGGASRLEADLGGQRPYGLACAPDGRHVVYGWAPREGESYRLTLLDLERGERRFLSRPPPGIAGDGEPAFSPDGETIAFLRNHYGLIQDVYVVPVAPASDGTSASERRVTAESRKIPDVIWSPDGRDLLFTRYGGGDHRLWTVSAEGGPATPVPVGEGAMTLTLDAAGRRLAYTRYVFRFRFWRLDLSSGEAEPLPLLSSTRFDSEIAVAPDGERLAFVSTRSGDFEVWVAGVDAAAPRRLTELGGPTIRTPSWSPDGRWIAFVAGVGGDADLWRIDARGGLPERLTAGPDHEVAPWWSRDGRWLYYASNRTGRWEIWRQPAGDPEGEERSEQVTRAGGHRGAESADGRWLYFTKRGEPGLWRRPLEDGGEATLVLPELGGRREGDWALGPRGVLFVTKDAEHHAVLARFTPEEGAGRGAVETVARLEDWPMNPSLALAPDGSWLVYSQGHDVESDVVLAERVF